jgi:hypothetical protein
MKREVQRMGKNNCLLCEQAEGEISVPGYDFNVCMTDWDTSWDGWAPRDEEKILKHLRQNNIDVPPRNSNGLLPRKYQKRSR